jgi:hypothetical protein
MRPMAVAEVREPDGVRLGVGDKRSAEGVGAAAAGSGVAVAVAGAVADPAPPALAVRLSAWANSSAGEAAAGISTTPPQCGQRALRPAAESGAEIVLPHP